MKGVSQWRNQHIYPIQQHPPLPTVSMDCHINFHMPNVIWLFKNLAHMYLLSWYSILKCIGPTILKFAPSEISYQAKVDHWNNIWGRLWIFWMVTCWTKSDWNQSLLLCTFNKQTKIFAKRPIKVEQTKLVGNGPIQSELHFSRLWHSESTQWPQLLCQAQASQCTLKINSLVIQNKQIYLIGAKHRYLQSLNTSYSSKITD